MSSWKEGNGTAVQTGGVELIDFLMDLDRMLRTDEGFILGKWIADAVRRADGNETYAEYLEYNARNQVRSLVSYPSTSLCIPCTSLDDPVSKSSRFAPFLY